jgi:putative nucleotidyltransferase with HDIG domain
MRRSTTLYIIAVILAAGCAVGLVAALAPDLPADRMVVVLLLAGLAITGEVLGFLLPHSARGSIAMVPYLAMIVLVPSWVSVVAALLAKAATEIVARVPGHKAVFNVAQLVITISVGILLFVATGGISLLSIQPSTLAHVSSTAGGQAVTAFAVAYLLNSLLVAGAIALDSQKAFFDVWRAIKLTSMGLDLLVSAPIFVFAWVYAAFGPIAAATLWVPFLGLRHAHRTNLELAQTNQELLELMVKSLEARDPYTSGHSRRVRQFSTIIARSIGLTQREIDHVARAALLHDVGKIHEKYAPILSKQDKLSPEEWATMQEHPADGANLVATMTRLRDVVSSIRHHHENWDGTGYPDGLAGDSIPLASRIIRFADTIDAMTTERPYRLPLTEAQVKAEVIRCRGTQFDPFIADRLLSSALWPALFASPAIGEKGRPVFTVLGNKRKSASSA